MEGIYARGMMATCAYLERMGMTVLDGSSKSHVIALDGDTVVWVDLRIGVDTVNFIHPAKTTIKKHARRAIKYAADRGLDTSVRVDLVTIRIIAEDRAFLRHERNL